MSSLFQQTTKVDDDDDSSEAIAEKLRLEIQNRRLHSTIAHYKQIIADTVCIININSVFYSYVYIILLRNNRASQDWFF